MTDPRPYHHGDLRRTLLHAAAEVIAADGPAALSLRALARRAGVSHAAPAHHFGDRTGLLTALAAEGYGLLADALAAIRPEPPDRLRDLGAGYVTFALTHPAHFDVMFRPHLLHPDDPELARQRERAWAELLGGITGEEEAAEAPRPVALAAWSLAHGYATLCLDGSTPTPDDPAAAFRELATVTALGSHRPRGGAPG
ncbi:TetR/AcrR family transcriptional regulator [Streptomyces sp. JJ38]|uniref:TetR/AcrR family transcriptional regulator n=1 Tax=Streptomyces sp. JJ38 TaxID=2738128 RepID=UPI001C5A1EB1|nr:TetR/AcrR family transcriptional regulator [Streptomyces sp. JJ38]MBW1600364.1 TetR/AcrR family transcriptional regulator [Streptomyces sp. JJ38]